MSVEPASPPAGRGRERLERARERALRAGDWAQAHVPGAAATVEAAERERMAAAGLLAGGLAYRFFLWVVPFGLVVAAITSFWVEEDPDGLEDAAQEFGIGGATAHAATAAIEQEAHARWYFLVVGCVLLLWFSMGVVRAMSIAQSVAWKIRPEKPRRPIVGGLLLTGVVVGLGAAGAAAAWLREHLGAAGLLVTLALVALYFVVALWIEDKLPHHGTWRALVPGAIVIAVGTQVLHLAVVLYLAPKLARSSELYGTLGAATVVLLWLYLVARIIVAGAFLNAARWERAQKEAIQ